MCRTDQAEPHLSPTGKKLWVVFDDALVLATTQFLRELREAMRQHATMLTKSRGGMCGGRLAKIGPFGCDPGHSLGSIWSAITDSFKGRFQVMHTQKQHWLDYDPVALAVLVIGMIGLLALAI